MQLIANGTQASATMPAKQAASGTPGYANNTPGNGTATVVDGDIVNTLLNEIAAVVLAAGMALDTTNNAQLLAATKALFGQIAGANTWTGANAFTASGANSAQIELTQTSIGHSWSVAVDATGNLDFYDATAEITRLQISPTGVANFQISPTIPNGVAATNPVALGQFPSSLTTNGYKKYPDPNSPTGYFIEQWGNASVPSNGSGPYSQNVTLPIAYPNSHLWCIANWDGTTPPGSGSVAANQVSLSQIEITTNAPTSAANGITWLSKGY